METYLKTLQNQSNVYQTMENSNLFPGTTEQYPHIDFHGNFQTPGDSLPNEEQLYNFLTCFDSSTSLTFEKLLQSSNQDSGYWCNDYHMNPPRPQPQDYMSADSNGSFYSGAALQQSHTLSRPRIIRGCPDYQRDIWNPNPSETALYSPTSAETDCNNNVMPCANKNYSYADDFSPKHFECREKQCQDFIMKQHYSMKEVDCDWNNNVADLNNNACALTKSSDLLEEPCELKIVSFLHHTKSLQTLAGKFHVHLEINVNQLASLTKERVIIEYSLFKDVDTVVTKRSSDQSTRTDRLVVNYTNENEAVKRIISKLGITQGEEVMKESRKSVNSWMDSIENVRVLRQNQDYFPRNEYLTRQIFNLQNLYRQTRRVRTSLWCISALTVSKVSQ